LHPGCRTGIVLGDAPYLEMLTIEPRSSLLPVEYRFKFQ
jgi:hypothetical protein